MEFKTIEWRKFKKEAEFLSAFMDLNKDSILRSYKPRDIWNVQKPFDVIWIENGFPLWIEFKLMDKELTEQNLIASLRQHQISNLIQLRKAGWHGYVIVYTLNKTTEIYTIQEVERILKRMWFKIV